MTTPLDQQKYWDDAAGTKEFSTPVNLEAFKKYVRPEAAVLEIGCGYGRVLEELRLNGYLRLTGLDFSEKMIARGRKLFPGLDLRVDDVANLADQSFDAVLLVAVLTCIVRDEDQLRLLSEVRRILRPGGILYINDFLLNQDDRNLTRYEKFRDRYGRYGVFELPEGAVLRHHDRAWVEKSLASFETLLLEEVVYTTMNGNRSNGYCCLGRK